MALIKKKFSEIPADAVVLTEEEALQYQIKILNKWKHPIDTLAFKMGPYILGGASFLTGLYLNSYFRSKFRLHHYGRASSYLPICVLPAVVSFVMKDVVLQKGNCPVCVEMRAASFQAFAGCIFPTMLGPASALALAHKYCTYDVPYITQEPRKVLSLLRTVTKPLANFLLVILIGQALLGSVVTLMEGRSVFTVNNKLLLLEKELESNS